MVDSKRISPKVGSTNFQPVMFDMDPFGGKKVPCTKYQESGIRPPSSLAKQPTSQVSAGSVVGFDTSQPGLVRF